MIMQLIKEIKTNMVSFLSQPVNAVIIIFFVVLVSHFSTKLYTSGDSIWSIPTAISIVKEGNVNLDEYKDIAEAYSYYGIRVVDGHLYNDFPIGVSLLALPFVFAVELFSSSFSYPVSLQLSKDLFSAVGNLEIFVASFVVAVTAIFIYFIARKFLGVTQSFLAVFVFAFCTSAWSTASRALWQHGPTMLMLSIALFLILSARGRPHLVQFASLPLAFSYVVRPTNSISIALLTIFIFSEYRKYFLRYVLWSLSVVIPFLIFNYSIYDSILSPYYIPQRIGASPHFLEAMAGNLISPGRGIFIFIPIFLLSLVGIYLKVQTKQFKKLDSFLIAIILLHWIVISSFPFWFGGWTIGPRLFSDMVPYFVYFLLALLTEIPKFSPAIRRLSVIILFILITTSFFIHYESTTMSAWFWNEKPLNVNDYPARLWNWSDIQFLRGLKYR